MDDALMTLSLTAAAAGVLVFGGLALRATLTRHRSARKLDTALSNMRTTAANPTTTSTTPAVPPVAKAEIRSTRWSSRPKPSPREPQRKWAMA